MVGVNLAVVPPRRSSRTVLDRDDALAVLAELAEHRHGVLYRPDLARAGVPRWLVQAELRARRWQRTGRQTVVTHNGVLTDAQRRAVAALEVGPRAALDCVTALQHDGIDVEGDGELHVFAPKGSTPRHPSGVRVHESRRFDESDVVIRDGVRMVRIPVAAVHAAIWAPTDQQARFFLVLAVQQRRATSQQLRAVVDAMVRCPRRAVLLGAIADLDTGVRSMSELDFAGALRRHGLPEPDRQVVRRRPSGREYLDCRFGRFRLTVEIDGVQHDEPEQRLSDVVRDLTLVAEGDAVIRIPRVALALDQAKVMRALEAVFVSRGWRRAA